MNRSLAAAFALLAAGAAAGAPPAERPPGLARRVERHAAFGVTPGGFLFSLRPPAWRLVLRDAQGVERLSLPTRPDEGYVLSVADDGSRVTSSRAHGTRRPTAFHGKGDGRIYAELVFRLPDGDVAATRRFVFGERGDLAPHGRLAYVVDRDGAAYRVRSLGADGDVEVATIPAAAVTARVGEVRDVALHPSPSGLLVRFFGPVRSAYFLDGRADPFLVPEETSLCEGDEVPDVVRRSGGLTLAFHGRTGGALPPAFLQTYDASGKLVRTTSVSPSGRVVPLADGGLAVASAHETVLLDADDVLRARLPSDPDRAASVWRPRSATEGLARLAATRDGAPDEREARRALHELLSTARGEKERLLQEATSRARSPGASRWLRQIVGFAVVSARPKRPPGWAFAAVADGLAEGDLELSKKSAAALPPALVSQALALDLEAARERAVPARELLSGTTFLDETSLDGGLPRWLPVRSFPREALECLDGAPWVRTFETLFGLAEAAPRPDSERDDEAADEPVDDEPPITEETRGAITEALAEAEASSIPPARAVSRLAGPRFGRAVDRAAIRADALATEETLVPAALWIAMDEALEASTWKALLADALAALRTRTPDPGRCAPSRVDEVDADGRSGTDAYGYCFYLGLLSSSVGFQADGAPLGSPAKKRAAVLSSLVDSGAAPPELAAWAAFARGSAARAPEAARWAVFRDAELPWELRLAPFSEDVDGTPSMADAVSRELEEGALPASVRADLLAALSWLDAARAARAAAEAWRRGTVPRDGNLKAWLGVLDVEAVASDRRLADAVATALGHEAAGPEAALLLASAGDARGFEPLARALRIGALDADFEALLLATASLGSRAADWLEDAARNAPGDRLAPLDALFSIAPERATVVAAERLERALEAGCFPRTLGALMASNGLDPFARLADRLSRGRCDGTPAGVRGAPGLLASVVPKEEAAAKEAAKAAARRLAEGRCREEFEVLVGLDEPPGLLEEPPIR